MRHKGILKSVLCFNIFVNKFILRIKKTKNKQNSLCFPLIFCFCFQDIILTSLVHGFKFRNINFYV